MARGRVTLAWAVTGLCAASLPACLHRGEPRPRPPAEAPTSTPAFRPSNPAPLVPQPFPLGVEPPPRTVPVSFPAPAQPKIEVREIEPIDPEPPPVPPEAEEPLLAALRAYLDGRPDRAMREFEGLDEVNQQALLRLLPVVVELSRTGSESTKPENRAVMIDQLRQAAEALRSFAALKTGTVCFCRNVNEFGDYTPVGKKPSFRPGERADLYIELLNFHNEPITPRDGGADGGTLYHNRFRGELVLRDDRDAVVWREPWGFSAISRTARRDRHFGTGFTVPPGLHPGRYTLTVIIEDEPTGRKTRRSLDLWVGGVGRR